MGFLERLEDIGEKKNESENSARYGKDGQRNGKRGS